VELDDRPRVADGESSGFTLVGSIRDGLGRIPTANSEASEAGLCDASELMI
jgi:hypothetical protein